MEIRTCGPDGKCYAFDHRAQGYGRGEGVAVVVLKRLDDALKAGDPIQTVIRETASNQDGRTSTITSPDADAQYDLIRECYERAGLDPLDTPVVEAHGTGTKAGDPIEAQAIGCALRPMSKNKHESQSLTPVLMGSVKTNIGHTEAVSGLASLIKMAKSLEAGKVAPSINFEKPNADIDFDGLNIKVGWRPESYASCTDAKRLRLHESSTSGQWNNCFELPSTTLVTAELMFTSSWTQFPVRLDLDSPRTERLRLLATL